MITTTEILSRATPAPFVDPVLLAAEDDATNGLFAEAFDRALPDLYPDYATSWSERNRRAARRRPVEVCPSVGTGAARHSEARDPVREAFTTVATDIASWFSFPAEAVGRALTDLLGEPRPLKTQTITPQGSDKGPFSREGARLPGCIRRARAAGLRRLA